MHGIENIWNVTLQHYLFLGVLVFFIGFLVLLTTTNTVKVLLGLEVMLNGVGVVLVSMSRYIQNASVEVFTFFVLAVAAAEVGIGLSLVVYFFQEGKKSLGGEEVESIEKMMQLSDREEDIVGERK